MSTAIDGTREGARPTYVEELGEVLRVLVVAGVPLGVVVAGLGGRLAMLVLRLTSPEAVVGRETDDGFVIGEVTLAGTYNLLVLGATVGFIGAAAYVAVAPWLVGPRWARAATTGVTAGALVGSMLLHADGLDFTVLEPLWLAIGLFVGLPAVFGVLLAYVVERVEAPDHWSARGQRRGQVPVLVLLLFVPALVVVVPVAVVVAALLPLRRALLEPLRRSVVGTWVVRCCFATIPLLALVALARDLQELLG